jgi:hypothetical protein
VECGDSSPLWGTDFNPFQGMTCSELEGQIEIDKAHSRQ